MMDKNYILYNYLGKKEDMVVCLTSIVYLKICIAFFYYNKNISYWFFFSGSSHDDFRSHHLQPCNVSHTEPPQWYHWTFSDHPADCVADQHIERANDSGQAADVSDKNKCSSGDRPWDSDSAHERSRNCAAGQQRR